VSKNNIQEKTSGFESDNPAIEALIAQQGVSAINDLDQLSDLWPADDDPDQLLQFILDERQARGQISRDKAIQQ
jgi:hypothetical protein